MRSVSLITHGAAARRARQPRHRGAALAYAVCSLVAMAGVTTLAVDLGRVRLVKSELQAATDSAARQAAAALHLGVSTTQTRAIAAAGYNKADGAPVVLLNSDIEFGLWNPSTREFQVLYGSDRNSATAVRITAQRSAARNNAIQTVFGRLVKLSAFGVTTTSIATRGRIAPATIDANSCPWLAGMPSGSVVTGYDGNTTNATAPNNAPVAMSGLTLKPGSSLYFRQTNGQTSYANATNYGPDGNNGFIVDQRLANGINTSIAPLNSLVGIFLDNRRPDTYAEAAPLDFSTGISRDFDTLSPGLKQVFFIGDGMNSNKELQEFIVPPGATRLYIGIMDEKGWWWDNTGYIETSVLNETVTLVE